MDPKGLSRNPKGLPKKKEDERQFQVRLMYHSLVVLLFLLLINFVVAGMLAQMEGMSYTDGFYLAMSATTLAGYGNVNATTDASKWFIAFYQLLTSTIFKYWGLLVTAMLLQPRLGWSYGNI